ncbi:MAG TPA: DUF1697 domain-containing protein [Mycobacteriales bacterium]
MPTWVALLRAVNLGRVNKVSMPVLREALTEAGFTNVRTYVQSGNIVLDSPMRSAAKVGAAVGGVVHERFGVDTPVVTRTGRQLAAVLEWNPFPEAVRERAKMVHVVHLAGTPDADKVKALLAADVRPASVAHRGQEVVVDWVDVSGGSAADKALKKLGVDGTARNWRTLTALVELTRA